MKFLWIVLRTLVWVMFCSKAETFAKMLAFQQQLAVYSRKNPRLRLKKRDRLGIKSVRTAYRSPWQNPYVERVIGTLHRECLDHMILLNEKHLRRVLDEFVEEYCNPARPHLSLERNSPISRKIDPLSNGRVVSTPILHGLHHRYHRVA